MEQGTRCFTKFVNAINKTDLFACLALWMEECPLAKTSSFSDCESFSTTSNENNGLTTFKNNEEIYVGPVEENGPSRKRIKTNNCSDEVKNKQRVENAVLLKDSASSMTKLDTASEEKQARLHCEEVLDCANGKDVKEKHLQVYRSKINKIGVVMVDSSDKIVAMDCSRDNVHGVTSVLVDFCDRANNCVMYTSRKPCSFCTKLMIQAGISRVCYLPFKPEFPDQDDLDKAEKLFRMSAVGQSIYIPNIQTAILSDSEIKRSPYTSSKFSHVNFTFNLLSRYWSEQWKKEIAQQLNWPEFNDCRQQVEQSIQTMLEWIARITFGDLPDSVYFRSCDEDSTNRHDAGSESFRDSVGDTEDTPIIPDPSNPRWQDLARHMSRMANILSQRSNDPKRGVGAIILQRNQIVSASWNGYPSGAGYGDFPRASHSDGPLPAKKYAFSIHAEQAAILGRNTRDVRDVSSTLFVSKTPCDECVPLILKAGIKNVVFPRDTRKRESAFLEYALIKRSVALGKLKGFDSRLSVVSQKPVQHASRQLCFNGKVLVSDHGKNGD